MYIHARYTHTHIQRSLLYLFVALSNFGFICIGNWIHHNDARVESVSVERVLLAQAYILVYSRRPMLLLDLQPMRTSLKRPKGALNIATL